MVGLIRWKIVIHAFIDGKTRLVVGIRASNNNRAETVLELFHDCTSVHGIPSRVRGDHGTENVRVAEWMEENQGRGRGSYIWGRFVSLFSSLDCDIYRFSTLGVSITAGLRGSGMMLLKALVASGRIFSPTWKLAKGLMSTTLLTSGYSTTFSSAISMEMPLHGQKLGTTTNSRSEENHNRLHRKCIFSV